MSQQSAANCLSFTDHQPPPSRPLPPRLRLLPSSAIVFFDSARSIALPRRLPVLVNPSIACSSPFPGLWLRQTNANVVYSPVARLYRRRGEANVGQEPCFTYGGV